MGDNNNKNNNKKQGYKKNFRPNRKWNKNKIQNKEVNPEQNSVIEIEEVADVENITTDVSTENEVTTNDIVPEAVSDHEKEIADTEKVTENATTVSKKVVKDLEDEKEDFSKPKENTDETLEINWPVHDNLKLSTDFHRGCCINAEEYSVGNRVLRHSQCKLASYNWLKDYHDTAYEGVPLAAEIRFKNDRKDFYCYPPELELIEGEIVAVETAIGHDIGIVTMVGSLVERQRKRKGSTCPVNELKKVYRRARIGDIEKFLESTQLEERTLYRSREIALDLNLDMKLNDIEYQGDKTKAIFYYTAEGRVDFRELIKKLAEEFHIRVEMRQIGYRQESAKLGGIGSCGRELCCSSWITNFQSVTTNVARIQQLSPNPQKLAGQCGKLKCCLNYEYDTYVETLKSFPDSHINLKSKKGEAFYQKSDIFKGLMWYSYVFDKGNMMAIPAEKVKEIIKMNNKGVLPEQLEDYAFSKEQRNTEYGEEGQHVDLSKLE